MRYRTLRKELTKRYVRVMKKQVKLICKLESCKNAARREKLENQLVTLEQEENKLLEVLFRLGSK